MSYIPLFPDANYNSYAVTNNDYTITFPDGTVIPPWSSGILVVDADASLTLTCSDGSIISAYFNNVTNTWKVQKLKQKPDEAVKADYASRAGELILPDHSFTRYYPYENEGLYCITLRDDEGKNMCVLISIIDMEETAYSTECRTGYGVYWNAEDSFEVIDIHGGSSEIVKIKDMYCIAKYPKPALG